MAQPRFLLSLMVLLWSSSMVAQSAIGVNWGTISTNRLQPSTVVGLLLHNNISKVKLFDADPAVLGALMGTGIQVMVGVPNELLATLSSSPPAADFWVSQNVSRYMLQSQPSCVSSCCSS